MPASFWRAAYSVALIVALVLSPYVKAAEPPPSTEPPQVRLQPPVGIISGSARLQPPVGAPDVWIQPPVGVKSQVRVQPPVGEPIDGDAGFLAVLTSWLRARIGVPIG